MELHGIFWTPVVPVGYFVEPMEPTKPDGTLLNLVERYEKCLAPLDKLLKTILNFHHRTEALKPLKTSRNGPELL